MILAGFDEAGYGPRLGPLLVAWTAFRVPDPGREKPVCLWKALRRAVRSKPKGPDTRILVADSKVVRPLKDGLRLLELGALSFLRNVTGTHARSMPDLLRMLGGDAARYARAPWYDGIARTMLPAHAWPGEIAARSERLALACEKAGVECAGAAAIALPEWEFNDGCSRSDSKAVVMQEEAFAPLLVALRESFPDERILVVADKHGGRDFYGDLLSRIFAGAHIEIETEGSERSAYRLETERGPLSIRFEPRADGTHFPVALASMICKYVRELFMDSLNAFFKRSVNDALEPTAGYPGDAERFISEIEPSLEGLGISRKSLVRTR